MVDTPEVGQRHRAAFAGAAAVVVALDQLTKHWALQALDDGPIDLVGSLRFKLVFNDGAAFSLGSGRTSIIAAFGLLVAGYLVYLGLNADRRGWALGLGVLFGGAAGNLVDRIFRAGDGVLGGHVVDFVDLQWWPVFNVADIALWIGIGLLVLSSSREAISR
ncbi:MAG TPA: signal peptidase II [Acidimicrobiales bacterium]